MAQLHNTGPTEAALPGMKTLRDVEIGLLQELANEEDGGGGSISSNIILAEVYSLIESTKNWPP